MRLESSCGCWSWDYNSLSGWWSLTFNNIQWSVHDARFLEVTRRIFFYSIPETQMLREAVKK